MTDAISMTVERAGTTWPDQIVFTINGEDLRRLVQDEFGSTDGMTGPPTAVVTAYPDHLLGGPDRWEDPTDPWYHGPAILGCGCGQPGCGAVLVSIEVGAEEVTWSNFRFGRVQGDLGLGPFRFNRRSYDAEVEKIRRQGGT